MKASILYTKLQRPSVAPDIVPRDRLIDLLQEGHHRPLTLISAPAGYGKSTLTSRWADTRKDSDVIGLGLNWSRPSSSTLGADLDDQYTMEVYYRWQVLKILAITPDVQILMDPALNPDKDLTAVFGLRGRISF